VVLKLLIGQHIAFFMASRLEWFCTNAATVAAVIRIIYTTEHLSKIAEMRKLMAGLQSAVATANQN
jgi:hypothetical protein